MALNELREQFHKSLEMHNFDYSNPEVIKLGLEFEKAAGRGVGSD